MIDRIFYRFSQLMFALSARIKEEDVRFARRYLNIGEAALFFSLPFFEQKHSVVVAQKMMAFAKGSHKLDREKLIRLGLLHDIGKAAVRLTIFDKALLVILHRGLPPLYNFLAKLGAPEKSQNIFRQFYVHKHHGLIGSKMLERIGENRDIINEVALHDRLHTKEDEYVEILDKADGI